MCGVVGGVGGSRKFESIFSTMQHIPGTFLLGPASQKPLFDAINMVSIIWDWDYLLSSCKL